MSKHTLKNDVMTFSMSYRAVCKSNDYVGAWRSTEDEALQDALDHQSNHMHEVRIEVEQSQRMQFDVNQEKLALLKKKQ
jgi:hypothetical protein